MTEKYEILATDNTQYNKNFLDKKKYYYEYEKYGLDRWKQIEEKFDKYQNDKVWTTPDTAPPNDREDLLQTIRDLKNQLGEMQDQYAKIKKEKESTVEKTEPTVNIQILKDAWDDGYSAAEEDNFHGSHTSFEDTEFYKKVIDQE